MVELLDRGIAGLDLISDTPGTVGAAAVGVEVTIRDRRGELSRLLETAAEVGIRPEQAIVDIVPGGEKLHVRLAAAPAVAERLLSRLAAGGWVAERAAMPEAPGTAVSVSSATRSGG